MKKILSITLILVMTLQVSLIPRNLSASENHESNNSEHKQNDDKEDKGDKSEKNSQGHKNDDKGDKKGEKEEENDGDSDDDLPVENVTLPDIIVEATSNKGAIVNFDPLILPDSDETVVGKCSPVSGTQFALGTTTVKCSGLDVSEPEILVGTFNVVVRDTTPPVITLLGSSTVSFIATSTYSDLGATATDIVDGDLTSKIATTSTVVTNTPGTYTVKYNVTDSHGNHATEVVRIVIVLPLPSGGSAGGSGGGPVASSTPDSSSGSNGNGTGGGAGDSSGASGSSSGNSSNGGSSGGSSSSSGGSSGNSAASNGPIVGSYGGGGGQVLGAATTTGQVLGESCSIYLTQNLRRGSQKNKLDEVKKLQEFLNTHMGLNVPTTGYFGQITENAVKTYQTKYSTEVLAPWGESNPTGIVYLLTVRKINNTVCPDIAPDMPELVPWSQNPNAQ